MKARSITFLFLVFTIFSFAQTDDSKVLFGFGVSLTREIPTFASTEEMEIMTLPIDLANFSLVIKGKNFRIEPSLGYFTGSSDYSNGQYHSDKFGFKFSNRSCNSL